MDLSTEEDDDEEEEEEKERDRINKILDRLDETASSGKIEEDLEDQEENITEYKEVIKGLAEKVLKFKVPEEHKKPMKKIENVKGDTFIKSKD